MITRKTAPAFAAGCSVVIKPPSETPFNTLALAKLALQAGIPKNCIHVLPTKDREASQELTTQPMIEKVSFTGSTGVGRLLTKQAAGKNGEGQYGARSQCSVYRLDDADLELAVDGAMICKFRCSGQTYVISTTLQNIEDIQTILDQTNKT